MPPPSEPNAVPKLNILALPSHTAILFGLIAFVVLGAAAATLLPGSRLWWPPIVFGLMLLPLRDFFARPDAFIAHHGLTRHEGPDAEVLVRELASLEALARDPASQPETRPASDPDARPAQAPPTPARPPAVMTTPRALPIESLGTFRRRYIAMTSFEASALRAGLDSLHARTRDRNRTILAHELAHFINRDVRLVWLSHAMLKMLALTMAANMWIGLALSAFLIEVGPEVLRPEFWTALSQRFAAASPGLPTLDLGFILTSMMQQKPDVVAQLADPARGWASWQPFLFYLIAAQLPLAVAGVVLYCAFWPQLFAVREYYADARAVSLIGDTTLLPEAMKLNWMYESSLGPAVATPGERLRGWLADLQHRWQPQPGSLAAGDDDDGRRAACLADPLVAFGSWPRIAIAAGVAAVLLDVALRGTLTASYVFEPGAYAPFLLAFFTFTTWLLPFVCSGAGARAFPSPWLMVRIVAVFSAIELVPHLLDGLAGVALMQTHGAELNQMLDLWAYSLAGAGGSQLPAIMGVQVSWAEFMSIHIVRPILCYALCMPPILSGLLWLDTRLKRRALTWYRLGPRVKRVFAAITVALAAVLALGVIPLLDHVLFPEVYPSWTPSAIAGLALALLVLAGGALVFHRLDRQMGQVCPHCGQPIPGDFDRLGKTCEACRERGEGHGLLHGWLLAAY